MYICTYSRNELCFSVEYLRNLIAFLQDLIEADEVPVARSRIVGLRFESNYMLPRAQGPFAIAKAIQDTGIAIETARACAPYLFIWFG